jgi:hypothetical protein
MENGKREGIAKWVRGGRGVWPRVAKILAGLFTKHQKVTSDYDWCCSDRI